MTDTRSRVSLTAVLLIALIPLALIQVLSLAASSGWQPGAPTLTLLSYLVIWVPLLLAVVLYRRGTGRGARMRPIDLLWGLSVALLARFAASLLELGVYGGLATADATLGPIVVDAGYIFAAILAPLVFAPVIEELFFRGLFLRTARQRFGNSTVLRRAAPIALSSVAFAALHVSQAASLEQFVVVGGATLIFGVAAACLATFTGRLAPAIIAHVTFNALVVLPLVAPVLFSGG